MENNSNNTNKFFNFLVVVVIGVLAGVSVLVSMSSIVKTAINPVENKIIEVAIGQKSLARQLNIISQKVAAASSSKELEIQVAKLQGRLEALESRGGGAAAPAPAPQRPQPPAPDYNKVHELPVADSYVFGPKNAKVTIVEFSDFECPFCARFHGAVAEVAKAYPKDVNYMIKNFPLSFHQQARPAAKAALAAGEQGKYFEMAEALLKNFNQLSEDKFHEIAKDIGLNMKKFKKDLEKNNEKYDQIIADDIQLGLKVGVRGTPTFFLNGKLTPARTLDAYKAAIDKILEGEE